MIVRTPIRPVRLAIMSNDQLSGSRVRHMAIFRLKHEAGSAEEGDFIAALKALSAIPGVEAFQVVREVSPKNGFSFAVTMEFADGDAYEGYNNHPDHVAFVEGRWLPEVEEFMEVDYAGLT